MQLMIYIPNKDIPKHQEVIDICLHFIDGHIVNADGYGFVELPKGHGRLIDGDELESRMKIGYCIVRNTPTIIEADTESEVQE